MISHKNHALWYLLIIIIIIKYIYPFEVKWVAYIFALPLWRYPYHISLWDCAQALTSDKNQVQFKRQKENRPNIQGVQHFKLIKN